MPMEGNSIPVEADLAQAYLTASADDRKKLQALMRLWLRDLPESQLSLGDVMDLLSARAEARGLTPEIFEL